MRILLVLFFSLGFSAMAKPDLHRQWSRSTLNKPYLHFRHMNRMSPILTDELVIQGNAVDGIKAFGRDSGRKIWSFSVRNGVEGGAVLDGDNLYFGAGDGRFYCLSVQTGQVLWKFPLNSESLTQPLVQGPYVFHITGNNTLYSFDKKIGRSLWIKANAARSNMTVRGQTSPVYDRGVLYVGFSDGYFSAIQAKDGKTIWSRRIGDDNKFSDVDARAVLSSSCLLVSSFSNALYCLNKTSGDILWRHDYGGYHAVYMDRKKIYYPTANGEIHWIDEDSGKLLKKTGKLKGLSTEIVGFGNFIIHGESQGALVFREKESLKKVYQFSPGRGLFARPTVDEQKGEIYFISNGANLFRLDFKEDENPFLWSHELWDQRS